MKNLTTKKRGLDRVELGRALGCSLSTVDNLIRHGLPAIGTRGRAKVYRLVDARRLARRLAPKDPAAAAAARGDYGTHVEDLADRRERLRETFIADSVWRRAWKHYVAAVAHAMRHWPRVVAERIGATSRAAAVREIGMADEVFVPSPRYVPPGSTPPPDPPAPVPLMRPLFARLAQDLDAADRALARALAYQPATSPPASSTPTLDAARSAWRQARAAYRATRTAVRRDHRRREDLVHAIEVAIAAFRRTWWRGARGDWIELAGNREAALAATTQLRAVTLQDLAALGGLLPAPSETPTARRRR